MGKTSTLVGITPLQPCSNRIILKKINNKIYTPIQIVFARKLRKKQTASEIRIWNQLRNRRFLGFKFLRQHPIVTDVSDGKTGFYIADFYCAEKKLVIEIDGLIHSLQVDYDKARDHVMKDFGLIVLRITNAEVENNIVAVLNNIKSCLQ